jgi:hypothetical protein
MDEFGPDTIALLDDPWDDFDQPCASTSHDSMPGRVDLLNANRNEGYTYVYVKKMYKKIAIASQLQKSVPIVRLTNSARTLSTL